jgi:hypothetical protein
MARAGGGAAFAGGRTAWNGGGNWHGGNFQRRHFFPGAVAGAVIGAGVAGAYAYGPDYYGSDYYGDTYYDNGYDNGYSAGPEVAVVQEGGGDASYCAQRYKSWDPASGTYLGYDGQRHPCP